MTPPVASIRDALLEMLAAVGEGPYRSARLLRAVERAHKALGHTPEPEGDNRIVASGLPITGRVFSGELNGGSRMADKRSPSLRGLCENCDDPVLREQPLTHRRVWCSTWTRLTRPAGLRVRSETVGFRYDLQLYLCDSCYAFHLHELEISGASA